MAEKEPGPASLYELVVKNSAMGERLQALSLHAMLLNRIEKEIQCYLPGLARKRVKVANFNQGKLVLETGSQKEMLLLSTRKVALMKKLKPLLQGLCDIAFIVREDTGVKKTSAGARSLSPESAAMLEWVASLAPEGLSEALQRLARYKHNVPE
ncbi:hypothetical protein AAF463_24330 (plasmid) [Pantoea sp. BJ2]|uniref:DUF721 domain-containing protein n=1 Tax=Pantoea sp. BJ2 TaxID=3141322 RepID=A0AAU7U3A5_9GAMM